MASRSNKGWSKKLERRINDEFPRIMESAMLRVESEAKRIVYLGHPDHLERQTGTLGRSITTETIHGSAPNTFLTATGTNIEYAPIHEFGGTQTAFGRTSVYIPPRPFLIPAFESKKDDVKKICEDGLRNILKSVKV